MPVACTIFYISDFIKKNYNVSNKSKYINLLNLNIHGFIHFIPLQRVSQKFALLTDPLQGYKNV